MKEIVFTYPNTANLEKESMALSVLGFITKVSLNENKISVLASIGHRLEDVFTEEVIVRFHEVGVNVEIIK